MHWRELRPIDWLLLLMLLTLLVGSIAETLTR